jgi:hypothetical protein
MAGIAFLVGFGRRLMSSHHLVGGMAAGAGAIKLMVLDVAPGALHHGGIGPQRYRLSVAVHTLQTGVFLVLELDRSRPGGVRQDRNGYHHRPCGGQLGCLVTGRAIALRWRLMMTDLAPPGPFECQGPTLAGSRGVAGDAGELLVLRVGEGVGGEGFRERRPTPARVRSRWSVALAPRQRGRTLVHGRPLLGGSGIERQGWLGPSATPVAHLLVAAGTIAGIYLGLVWQVTGRTLFGHPAMADPKVKRLVPPGGVARAVAAAELGFLHFLLGMWIVAHAAGAAVGILRWIELSQPGFHLVA